MKTRLRRIGLLLFFAIGFFQIGEVLSRASSLAAWNAEPSEKIAVAAVGDTPGSQISSLAGRAPYYLIFDSKGVFLKAIKNPGQRRGCDSSTGVVDMLQKESCKRVIAGRFGSKMRHRLGAHNIDHHERQGTAAETVAIFVKTGR